MLKWTEITLVQIPSQNLLDIKDVKPIYLIWVDASINKYEENKMWQEVFAEQLKSNANVATFAPCTTIDEAVARANESIRCSIIVSGSLCQEAVPKFNGMTQVKSILIFTST